ncbi:MAG: pyridoxamine 5'-phosphate oxidase [Polyangiaceae bacterium]
MTTDAGHPGDPLALFAAAFEEATKREVFEANAMSLATVDGEGRPSVRVVLLKGTDARGFTFFTNYTSRKARELDGARVAALGFHWPKGELQVRAEGAVERVSAEESDAYFATRHRESQIGAWASHQSQPLASREALEARVAELTKQFEGPTGPRPPHWGGYRLVPRSIEFWYGRPSRLHVRHAYTRETEGAPFEHQLLFP